MDLFKNGNFSMYLFLSSELKKKKKNRIQSKFWKSVNLSEIPFRSFQVGDNLMNRLSNMTNFHD